jgi:hypothetical protein
MSTAPTPYAPGGPADEATRLLLRHLVATIAFRTRVCLAGAPLGFGAYTPGDGVRTPTELVVHLVGLCRFAQGLLTGLPRQEEGDLGWREAVGRLEAALRALDAAIAEAPMWHHAPTAALQGPLADALTHVGQLAMLRRLASAPVAADNYARAPIEVGDLALGER